jgi:hypothetical protein
VHLVAGQETETLTEQEVPQETDLQPDQVEMEGEIQVWVTEADLDQEEEIGLEVVIISTLGITTISISTPLEIQW